MYFLTDENKSLQAFTASAPYGDALPFIAVFIQNSKDVNKETGEFCETGTINDTPASIIEAPEVNVKRTVKSIHIHNSDGITHTIEFRLLDGMDSRTIFKCVLEAEWTVAYYNESGWRIYDNEGAIVERGGAAGGSPWGDIDGTLSDQTDLQGALDEKAFVDPRITAIVSSSTPTPNSDTTDLFIITALGVAATFQPPAGTPQQGRAILIRVKDDGVARALAFNSVYRFSTDLPAPTTTIVGKTFYLAFVYNSTDVKWDCVGQINNF